MRRSLLVIIYLHLLLVAFLLYCCFDLLCLPLVDPNRDALLHSDLNPPNGTVEKPMIIPKIIHQTYKTEDVPEVWKAGQQACIDLHPDYKYILWTDEMSREFIAKQYPWFLNTWDKYKFPIERADAIRYFALAHFGGVYIDLDDGCRRRLDPLLTVPAFVRSTSPSGVSNDIMGAVPGHPFFIKVLNNLQRYNRNWLVPYITIMFSTGPLFLSVILEQYNRYGVPDTGKVRVLLPADYKGNDDSFLKIAPGSSWHTDDAKFIKTLGRHIPLAVFTGFMVAGLVFLMEWYLYKWCVRLNFNRMKEKVRGWFNRGRMGRPRKDSNLPVQIPLVKAEVV